MVISIEHSWKHKLYAVIFTNRTRGGRIFDAILLVLICASLLTVICESVETLRLRHEAFFFYVEWVFTALFTLEYVLRIYCSPARKHYIFSFFGLIDLLTILPTYIDIFADGVHYMMVVRVLRLLRIFRILKLTRYLSEAEVLRTALVNSRAKITVFVGAVLTMVVIIGAIMYIIEGPSHGFRNIPISIYWAIVTLTTVGYGDISPTTPLGQVFASMVMILGYGIIAVPTGIVSVEFHEASKKMTAASCGDCGRSGHTVDAAYCKYCGVKLRH